MNEAISTIAKNNQSIINVELIWACLPALRNSFFFMNKIHTVTRPIGWPEPCLSD